MVKKPTLLQDFQAPLQKLCKNSQWFDKSLEAGTNLVKPDRYALSNQFRKQTDKIWQVSYLNTFHLLKTVLSLLRHLFTESVESWSFVKSILSP